MSLPIIPELQTQFDIEAKLKRWKEKLGEDAKFVSDAGFPFNCFDDAWTLSGEGSKGQKLYLDFFHSKDWSNEVQCHIRLALAKQATKQAVGSLRLSKTLLTFTSMTCFSVSEIAGEWPLLTESNRNSMKVLFLELKEINKLLYGDASDWVQENHVPQLRKVNPYDIEKGALSEFERQSFERELARRMQDKLSTLKDNLNDFTALSAMLVSLKYLMMVRLVYALVRRPVNLSQAKWSDILPVGASFFSKNDKVQTAITTLDFSDEDELQVRIFKAKDKSMFRQSVERYSLRLNAKLTQEVLSYRKAYRQCLQCCLSASNISVTTEELDVLMMRSPVAFIPSFFETKFSDKAQVFSALSEHGTGFHDSSSHFVSGMRREINALNLKSDRVPNLKVGNNRIRHTVGTMAAIMGYDTSYIADLLGNTTSAARIYVDLSDEQRANIDNKFIANHKLKQMFDVDIATLQKDQRYTMSDSDGNEAGQAKNRQSCTSCNEIKRPLACYGCNNFEALEDGDHRNIRNEGQRLYDKRIADGDPAFLLGKIATQIKWVEATIAICDERIANRSALNA
jgi:integrase